MAVTNTNLGRVGFVLKGEYSTANSYKNLDVVTYNNSIYAARAGVSAGQIPGQSSKWIMLVDGSGITGMDFGSENAGKILFVGSDGSVKTTTFSSSDIIELKENAAKMDYSDDDHAIVISRM